jgi:hypothetical protein
MPPFHNGMSVPLSLPGIDSQLHAPLIRSERKGPLHTFDNGLVCVSVWREPNPGRLVHSQPITSAADLFVCLFVYSCSRVCMKERDHILLRSTKTHEEEISNPRIQH